MAEETAPVENQEAQQEGLLADATLKEPPAPATPEETSVEHIAQEKESEAPTERPENVPEKFWNAEKGEARFDDILKAHKELETKFSSGKHKTPKDGKYDLGFVKEQGIAEDDPLLGKFQELAKDMGISQDNFDSLVGAVTENAAIQQNTEVVNREKQMEILGPQAQEIIDEQVVWARKLVDSGYWGNDDFDEFKIWGGTAGGIRALRSMRRFYSDVSTIPTKVEPQLDALPSEKECYAMVADERYNTDPGFREKVENIFARKFGSKPDHRVVG